MSVIYYGLGTIFVILLWILLDLRIGRLLYLKRLKKNVFPERLSDFQLYTEGKTLFKQFFEDIEKATDHIHILFFIIRNDKISQDFIHLLCKKAKQGVQVRVLLDKVGGRDFPKTLIQELEDHGAFFCYSHNFKLPFLFFSINQRNHRKIAIIDGKTGYLGGFNIGEEYLGNGELGLWRDYHLRLKGTGVQDIQSQFLIDWNENTKHAINQLDRYYPRLLPGAASHRLTPTEAAHLLGTVDLLISSAKNIIYIGSPYFIPGIKVFTSLREAQKRGVKLVIMCPEKRDHYFVKEAARPYLRKLLLEGADVYYFKKGFFHGKIILIDNQITDIGTANFDLRSFHTNHEMNCIINDKNFTKIALDAFKLDLLHSKKLTLEDLKNKNLYESVGEWFSSLWSPFL